MTNKHFFLLIFFSSFFAWGASAQNNLLADAKRLVDIEKLDSAVIQYEALVRSQPQNNAYKQALLDLYFVTNRPTKAVNLCASLLKSPEYAQSFNFHFGYVDLMMMAGQYSKARKHLLSIKDATWVSSKPMLRAGIEARIEKIDFAESNKDINPAFVVQNQNAINSKYPDFGSQIIQNEVYFESKRPVANPSGMGGYSDVNTGFLYKAKRLEANALSNLSTVYPIQSPEFAHNANLAPFCYNKVSGLSFLSQNSFPTGTRHPIRMGKGSGTYLGYFTNKSLDKLPPPGPGGLPNDFEHSATSSGFPCLTDNGKTLYFASTAKFNGVGYGGYDIWVSYYKNGNWTVPRNLGPRINTPGNELSPFVDDNGKLYFSSDALFGFGGFDVFLAQKTEDGWGAVRNLGPELNSSQDDLYFVFDATNDVGYFSSNRKGGLGDYDIYAARFVGTIESMPALFDEDEVIVKDEPTPAPTPQPDPITDKDDVNKDDPDPDKDSYVENKGDKKPLYDRDQIEKDKEKYNSNNTNNDPYSKKIPCAENAYIGVVLDAATQRPIEAAWVYVQNMKNGVKFKKLTSKYGEYAVILEPQTQYEILCSREGYQNLREEVYTGDGKKHTLLGQLSMNPSGTNIENNDLSDRGSSNDKVVNEDFTRATVANKAIPAEGYLVQIGVFKDLPIELRSELEKHANILSVPHKNLDANIYRLGIFAEKTHANEVLAKVRAMKDFKGAFLKTEALSNVTSAERMSNGTMVIFPLGTKKENVVKNEDIPTNNSIYGDPEKNVVEDNKNEWAEMPRGGANNDVVVVENPRDNYADNPNLDGTTGRGGSTVRPLEYKVQIGAYKKPESANFPDLSHVGKLEKRINRSNGLTYFFVTGYTSLDDARKARVKVESAGVKSAFIVAFKNGARVPLTDAVN